MPNKDYHVTGPDGVDHVINGPDNATDAEVIAQAQKLFPASKVQAADAANKAGAAADAAHPTESPLSAGLSKAWDQTKSFLTGAKNVVTGLPAAAMETGRMLQDANGGDLVSAAKRARAMGAGAVDQVVSPIRTGVKAAAPLVMEMVGGNGADAQKLVGAPETDEQQRHGAESAGGLVGQMALGEGLKAAGAAATPENLQLLAERAKLLRQNGAGGKLAAVGAAAGGAAGYALGGTAGAAGGALTGGALTDTAVRGGAAVAAPLLEKLARIRAEMQSGPVAGTLASAIDPLENASRNVGAVESPVNRNTVNTPPVNPAPRGAIPGASQEPIGASRPGMSPDQVALQEMTTAQNEPVHTGASEAGQPQTLNGQSPIDRSVVNTPPVDPAPRGAIPGASQEPLNVPRPGMSLDQLALQETTAAQNEPVSSPMASAIDPLEQARTDAAARSILGPDEAPTGLDKPLPSLPPDEALARDAMLQNSKVTPQTMQLAARNAKFLLEAVPELRGVKPGFTFNTRLFNALDTTGHELRAVQDSIPGDRVVSMGDSAEKFAQIQKDAALAGDNAAVKAVAALEDLAKSNPTAENFFKTKAGFFDRVKLSSQAGSAAYQILKDISNSIEPKLKDLNQKWYTLKTSSELAGMDQFSGEKLKAAAEALKRQQKGITPSTTRGFRGGGL